MERGLRGSELERPEGKKVTLRTHGQSLRICTDEVVCLESIMGEQTGSPNQLTQKVIRSIEQQKPNWIECQLLKARKLSTEW